MLRLAAGAENEIDDNIKFLLPKFRLMVLEKLAIAKNFFRAVRCAGFAAMKDRDADGRFAEAVEPRIVR